VIDEAHHLSPDLLEELRLLGNLEGHGGKAVQVVLVGLTDLLNTLQYPELAAFRQRISIRSHLEPLSLEESADYLLAHLRAAGGRAERIFGMEALELLARQTGGIPRLLNQAGHLCLRLAAENGVSEVDVEVALEALAALGLAEPEMPDRESSPGEGFSVEQGESVADPSCRLFVAPARTA
jgi:type II secretory pathway predicted ATPase ExeA